MKILMIALKTICRHKLIWTNKNQLGKHCIKKTGIKTCMKNNLKSYKWTHLNH